jgi:hypothetical protein
MTLKGVLEIMPSLECNMHALKGSQIRGFFQLLALLIDKYTTGSGGHF